MKTSKNLLATLDIGSHSNVPRANSTWLLGDSAVCINAHDRNDFGTTPGS
jgi:hypothetical protein